MIFLGAKEKRGLVKGKQGSVKTEPHVQLLLCAKSIPKKSREARETTVIYYRTINLTAIDTAGQGIICTGS